MASQPTPLFNVPPSNCPLNLSLTPPLSPFVFSRTDADPEVVLTCRGPRVVMA